MTDRDQASFADNRVPAEAEVREELARLVRSESLSRSERLVRFLSYVVDRTLAGESDQLKEYLIGVEVFGKGQDFDPRLDSAVRVDARRLRAKLEEYYGGEGSGNPVRILMPKGAYVPTFAYPSQATAEPVAPAVAPAAPAASTGRRLVWMVPLAIPLVAALLWFLTSRPSATPAGKHVVRTLAVLPFTNMTGAAQFDTVADSLAQELTDRIARIQGISVVSRTSAFSYKGKQADARTIARELNVDSLIEGSVRQGSGNLRIAVQLIRGTDGSQVWSESFDLASGDELGMQTQMARVVEKRLSENLPPGAVVTADVSEEEQRINNLVIQAGFLIPRRTPEALRTAIQYAQEAIRAKPQYAPAYAVLADAYLAVADSKRGRLGAAELELARANAAKATELNPNLAGPFSTSAAIKLDYEYNWREAEELLKRALSVNPNHAVAQARYARLLTLENRREEALKHARQADLLAPLSIMGISTVAQTHFYARRYDDAIATLRRAIEFDSVYRANPNTIARSLSLTGRTEEARTEAARLGTDSAEAAALHAWLLCREGKPDEARPWLAKATQAASISHAGALAACGRKADAFGVLEQAIRDREQNVVYIKVSPALDPLRDDPKLETLCAKVGLAGCLAGK